MSFFEKRTVYILRSDVNPDRHYTGVTSNVTQRLQWHNDGLQLPWTIVALWAHPAITGSSIILKDVDKVICWSF